MGLTIFNRVHVIADPKQFSDGQPTWEDVYIPAETDAPLKAMQKSSGGQGCVLNPAATFFSRIDFNQSALD